MIISGKRAQKAEKGRERGVYYGKKRERERRRFPTSDVCQGPLGRCNFSGGLVPGGCCNNLSSSWLSIVSDKDCSSAGSWAFCDRLVLVGVGFLFRVPRGKTMKKLMSMKIGRYADVSNAPLELIPKLVVATAYIPAPTKPAPPVPLPQAAKLNGP